MAPVLEKTNVFTRFWITWLNGVNDAIANVEANADAQIAINTADIATNVTNITNNSNAITGNTITLGVQGTQIGVNTTNISTNATNIANNTTAIGDSISDNVYGAAWNGDTTTSASKNSLYDKIESLDSDIIANAGQITTNGTFISTNTTNIFNNTTNITTNTTNIGANTTDISQNGSDITVNTMNIATLSTDSSTNSADISALEVRSSLTVTYEVTDITTPLFDPPNGAMGIYITGKDLRFNENPLSNMTLPDMLDITYMDVFFGGNKFLTLTVDSILVSSGKYTVSWVSGTSSGSIALNDICSVTFHWQ